jgi:hypothetical protein
MDYRGSILQNIRILVCDRCCDEPQEQLRTIALPVDPYPILNVRPENYQDSETNYLSAEGPPAIDAKTGLPVPNVTALTAEDGTSLVSESTGNPAGLDFNAVMPLQSKLAYNVRIPVLSVYCYGNNVVTVTCSSAHNLVTGNIIYTAGLSNIGACGFFTVTVATATAFTYSMLNPLAPQALLTGSTLVNTAIVGLPYGETQLSAYSSPNGFPYSRQTVSNGYILDDNGAQINDSNYNPLLDDTYRY